MPWSRAAVGTNVVRRMNEIKSFRQRSFLNDLWPKLGWHHPHGTPRFFCRDILGEQPVANLGWNWRTAGAVTEQSIGLDLEHGRQRLSGKCWPLELGGRQKCWHLKLGGWQAQ